MLTRRAFLEGAAALALLPAALRVAPARAATLPDATRKALAESGLVYVSPLRKDGGESTCHAEIWYGWLDGKVVVATGPERWRARAVTRGLDRARIWVGDYGRWKGVLGKNEAFRQGPSFDARAAVSRDRALFDRLMARFRKKYPDEFPSWDARMHREFEAGTRVLVVYEPA